jgi:hypothetical protein
MTGITETVDQQRQRKLLEALARIETQLKRIADALEAAKK